MRKMNFLAFAIIASVVLLTGFAAFYPSGAPAGYSGSPGDGSNCSSCHGTAATTTAGWITSDIPVAGYTAGQTYTITATNNMAGSGKYGYEVSSQNSTGTLLGTLTAGTNSQLVGSGKYITHTSASSTLKTWTFSWTAPAAGSGSVTFYGAFARGYKGATTLSTLVVTENSTSPPAAAGAITGLQSVCSNSSVNYSVAAISGATGYVWSVPAGATISAGQGTIAITVNFGANAVSGNVSVYGTNGSGNGTASNLAITVGTVPVQPGSVTGPDKIDLVYTATSNYTSAVVSNAVSYQWELTPAGAGSVAGTGITATVTWNNGFMGMADIRVKAINSCGEGGWSAVKSTMVTISTGIANKSEVPGMTVFPSPGNSTFTVTLIGLSPKVNLRILDVTGNEMYKSIVHGNKATTLNSKLAPGVYFVQVKEGSTTLVKKIVIR